MAEVRLTQAVDEAEAAIESGNYGGAIETCQRILGQFPEFARAHRIMAEAYAEQGEVEAAREAYQRTLERDPQSAAAHVGLGMLAEDANDLETAVAHYQVAWEIDPRRRELREQVSRVSQELYGSDGRLYLTRAALASLHFHAGRWDRAVGEAVQVLQELSARIDVQVRLAEALWRRGDDEQAGQVCTTILRALPSAVVPLLILADIERRQGNEREARNLRDKAREIDPDGVRAADLMMVGLDDQADFLSVDDVPVVRDQVVSEEPARYAPALDFMDPGEEAPSERSAPEPAASSEVSEESSVEDAPAPSVQPFSWEDLGDVDLEASDLDDAVGEDTGIDESSIDSETADDISFDLFTDEELEQARPTGESARGYTSMLDSLDSEGMQPFDPEGGSAESAESDDSFWDELALPSDEELDQARPPDDQPRGVTGELSSLETLGMEPFDPGSGEAQDQPGDAGSFLEDLSRPGYEDAEEPPVQEAAGTEEAFAGDSLDFDWSKVDQEIEEAIPGETPRGHTDELEELEEGGIEPFSFEAEEADTSSDLEAAAQELDAGSEALDLDELAASWSEEGVADEAASDEEAELDSIGVVFGEEDQVLPQQTEPLADWDDPFGLAQDADEEFGAAPAPREEEPLYPADWEAEEDEESFDEMIEAFEEEAGTDDLPGWLVEGEAEVPPPEFDPDAVEEEPAGFEMDTSEAEVEAQHTRSTAAWSAMSADITAERLGLDEELIARARQAKAQLVEEGVIQGDMVLAGGAVSLDELNRAVETEPDNVDHRIALASAMTLDDPDEALNHYRWIYRNAPERGAEIVDDLCRLIEVMREREVGVHRLLGAVYRRHGDWLAAATHYEESLTSSRRSQNKGRESGHE